jgi:hypothetical protein
VFKQSSSRHGQKVDAGFRCYFVIDDGLSLVRHWDNRRFWKRRLGGNYKRLGGKRLRRRRLDAGAKVVQRKVDRRWHIYTSKRTLFAKTTHIVVHIMIWLTLFALGVTCWIVANNDTTTVQQCQHAYLRRNTTSTAVIPRLQKKKMDENAFSVAAIRAHIRRVPPP